MNLARIFRPARSRSERGSVAIELALIMSFLFVILPAAFVFGNIFLQYNVLRNAGNGAAQYVAASGNWNAATTGEERQEVAKAMAKRLARESGTSPDDVKVVVYCSPTNSCQGESFDSVTVGVDVRLQDPFGIWFPPNKWLSTTSTVVNTNVAPQSAP